VTGRGGASWQRSPWESIKESPRVADYEAYLELYPEGSFITLARTRLDEFASAAGRMRDPQDREVELSFWESVRESKNPASLKAYLEKYPDGEFKSLAEIRLNELDPQLTSS
jgi:adenylate cyclase